MSEERWIIPKNWIWVKTKEIANIVSGGTPKTSDDSNFCKKGIPWLTPADLSNYEKEYISRGRRDISEKGLNSSSACLLPKNTVLFTSRAPIGYCVIAANEISTNQGFKSFVLTKYTNPKYIRFYLLASKDYAESLASGSTFKELSRTKAGELKIPLPPLNEQRRIVTKIEELNAHTRRAREALEDVSQLIEQFRQSVLAAAFRGDLTADWRKNNPDIEPASELLERIRRDRKITKKNIADQNKKNRFLLNSIPDSWIYTKIDDICLDSFYGPRFSKDSYMEGGIPSIRTTDMTKNGDIIISSDTPRLSIPEEKLNLYKVIKDDILITRSGSIGMMAIIKDDYLAIPSAYLIRFRFTSLILANYIFYYLRSPLGQNLLGLSSTSVTQSNINAQSIRALPIPLCSFKEQIEIVSQIKKIFAKVDVIFCQYNNGINQLDKLDRSILAKAFRGELVPQNPEDEPAGVLLERIRKEQKQKKPAAKRKRKKQNDTPTIPGLEA